MNAKLKIIFSMAVFGTLAIFVKNIPLSTGEIALFRALIALTAIVVYKLLARKKFLLPHLRKDLPILFLSGGQWVLIGFYFLRHTNIQRFPSLH